MTHIYAHLFAVPLALVVSLSNVAGPASAAERTLNRSVTSGAEQVIARATFWTSRCESRPFTLTITQPPANGTANVIEGMNEVMANPQFGTAANCVGQKIMGRQIMYRSKPGFHGADTLVYEVVSDKGERSLNTIAIEVK